MLLTALLFVVTIMYAIKTHPIIKILALFLNIIVIYNTYKTIINKQSYEEIEINLKTY